MPEAPDVELHRKYLDATALHLRIEHTHVDSPALLSGTTPQGLGRALKGRSFQSTCRHGKYLFAAVEHGGWLVLHFGMTGRLEYFQDRQDTPDYTRCLFAFANGFHLAYVAPRKLGRIALTDSPQSFIRDRNLGPDVLDLSVAAFLRLASQRRGSIKSWLMNQEIMAGIGNIYSDEILFQAGVHPRRAVGDLGEKELRNLHRSLRYVLKASIEAGADPSRMPACFLLPHRERRGHCPKCHAPLEKIQAAGRTAWYCRRCQRP